MISTSNSLAGTNTVAILQRWFRMLELKILLYLTDFRSRRLNTIAATSPFEEKNRTAAQSKDLESIEIVGIVSVFGILMYNIRPYSFCGGVKGDLKLRWSLQVPAANC